VHEQLELVLEQAHQVGLDLPAAEVVCKNFAQGVKDGRGEEDFSAVVKVLRK